MCTSPPRSICGSLLGTESFTADSAGYKAMLAWLGGFGQVAKVGIEGTGSYGAGLARFSPQPGMEVVEVDRQSRRARCSHGQSDPLDAVEAARAALQRGGNGQGENDGRPSGHPGAGRRQALGSAGPGQGPRPMRHLGYRAPDQLHCRLKGLSVPALVAEAAWLRPGSGHRIR